MTLYVCMYVCMYVTYVRIFRHEGVSVCATMI
jgi:hypothetical protein